MNEQERLIAALKRQLKKQGRTYRDTSKALGISEQTVKRLFSKGTLTVERLFQLAAYLGMSLEEIAQEASQATPSIKSLTETQEKELTAEPGLLLVAACAMNGLTLDQIVAAYRLSRAECLKRLLKLDRIGFLTLMPGDRIRLNVARDFGWLPGGPIERFFKRGQKDDFLGAEFTGPGEDLFFVFGMLTPGAKARLRAALGRLREEFGELHRESVSAPFERRFITCLLIAQREWEPRAFAALRRKPSA